MIVLLTDFGTDDVFVGVMKGVIGTIAPAEHVADLTHAIEPQDIAGGSFALLASYRYFPEQAIFVAVVDPGVGTARRPVAVRCWERTFVGPDNGLLTGVLADADAGDAVVLDNPAYHLADRVGATFHGRDIFAPVAAHLALGAPFHGLGTAIGPDTLIRLRESSPLISAELVVAHIQHTDRFGNLITDLNEGAFRDWAPTPPALLAIEFDRGPARFLPLCRTYGEVASNEACVLFNSLGLLEISVNGASAAKLFGLPRSGTPLRIYRR